MWKGKDVGDEEVNPVRARLLQNGSELGEEIRNVGVGPETEVDGDEGISKSSMGIPESGCSPKAEMIPVPDSRSS